MSARRPMTPVDIRRQVVLDEHDMAADGSVAVVSKRIIRRDRYETHLVRRAARARSGRHGPAPDRRRRGRITSGPSATAGRASPRTPATWPSCARCTNDEDEPTHLCLVPIAGGARPPGPGAGFGSVGEVAWSPDGRGSRSPPRWTRRGSSSGDVPALGRKEPLSRRDRSPLARRITRTDWRWDGIGHLDRWSHLFVVDADARRASRARSPRAIGACRTSPGARTAGPSPSPRHAAPTRTSCHAPRSGRWTWTPPMPSHARSSPRRAGPTTPRSRRTAHGSWRSGSTNPSRSTTSARGSSSGPADGSGPIR